ncbi:lipoate-protein ligase LplJ [Gottschalkia purinilytica]|uniref:lipoate--protein ligase n=1 Tax=Gottschalkia purinilytica TaxID=1503 RepID=A0A0L0WCL7_GOTPU|nr:lipoate--protein ligase [Gottschalkia purinilytica]KNF09212.1 lipoate-protein ligase LplJ [Gottschalkia purinilytica]
MLFIRNDSKNPYYNLALEEYALKNLHLNDDFLILWQNAHTVVVGRNQNTIEEVNSKYVKENDVNVVRRMSGGGAVYHDLGNLNYTFITRSDDNSKNNFVKFTKPVIDALETLDVHAEFSGRNDITIDGKKISGNAQYYYQDRMLHHGTILFDVNSDILKDVLNVKLDKIASKGIKSVKSRVTNICQHLKEKITIEELKNILLKFILETNDISIKEYILSPSDIDNINKLMEEKYSTWEWNYGESPKFELQKSKRYEGGSIDLRLNVKEGNITAFKIYGDFFGRKDVSELEKLIINKNFEEDSIRNVFKDIDITDYFYNITIDNFIDCMFY